MNLLARHGEVDLLLLVIDVCQFDVNGVVERRVRASFQGTAVTPEVFFCCEIDEAEAEADEAALVEQLRGRGMAPGDRAAFPFELVELEREGDGENVWVSKLRIADYFRSAEPRDVTVLAKLLARGAYAPADVRQERRERRQARRRARQQQRQQRRQLMAAQRAQRNAVRRQARDADVTDRRRRDRGEGR